MQAVTYSNPWRKARGRADLTEMPTPPPRPRTKCWVRLVSIGGKPLLT